MSAFDRAFALVIGHEGGHVNDPRDPGGETKFGISKRSYPNEDIAALTLERAKTIYHRDYWALVRGDELPAGVALAMFDYAVNSGVRQAVTSLQRAIGAQTDGVLGPATLAAIAQRSLKSTIIDLQAERIVLMAALQTFPTFGRGWSRRVILTAVEALTEEGE